VTLERRGAALDLGEPPLASYAPAPEGRRLALGSGDGARFTFVDLERMRRVATLDFGAKGFVAGLAWPTPNRVVGALSGTVIEILVADPAGRVVSRERLPGTVLRAARCRGGLVLLTGPQDTIGRPSLVVATPRRVDRVELPLDAGVDPPPVWEPGLAVSADGRRAFVVGAGTRVVEVDLGTLSVEERELSRRVSLLGRLRSWLEPAASAKGPLEGPVRSAAWAPGGRIAVSGSNHRKTGPRTGVADGAGLHLIDTRDWTVETLVEGASETLVAGDAVLAYGGSHGPDGLRGIGLRGFDADGRERFHLFGDRYVGAVSAVGRYAYVSQQLEEVTRVDVVDLATGRVVRTVHRSYVEVLPLD
jgi:hypothetical protein